MTDANELNEVNLSDAEAECKEEEELYSFQDAKASDQILQSMLSCFEASRTRAAVWEKLILEDVEALCGTSDLTAPCRFEDLPPDFDEEVAKLNEQGIGEVEMEDTSTDTSHHPEPSETEALLTHNVPVCFHNEGEGEGDEYLECEKHLALELRLLESSLKEEEEKKKAKHQMEREKRRSEEREEEERRRLRERDFEEEMSKMEMAEQLHQKDLEIVEETAREYLEQELLQQKELISSLRRQVEEERRRREEEEEEKIKKEQNERKKREEERKRQVEEERRRREEEEEEKIKKEQNEREKREDVRRKEDERKTKEEEERKRQQEEEEKIKKEQNERKKREEERKRQVEEERRRREEDEEEKIKKEQNEREKREDVRRKEDERKTKEEEERKRQQEEEEKIKKEQNERKKREEERKRQVEEERRRREEEEEEKIKKEQNERKKREEERKRQVEEERRRREEEEEEKIKKEQNEREKREDVRRKEDERKTKEEEEGKRQQEEEEKIKKEQNERKKREEERRRQVEEERRRREEEEKKIKKEQNERERMEEEDVRRKEDKEREEGARGGTELQKKRKEEEIRLKTDHISPSQTAGGEAPAARPSPAVDPPPSTHTEQKRLAWMRDCSPWATLSAHNRRKQRGTTQRQRRRRQGETSSLPPLCPDTLLQPGGSTSLQEVTTVTLEDLPGCSLSTLAQCPRLRSLTLRRCGLKALDGVSQCPELCYIDVQENDITFVDCENMASLRFLRLSRNQLTSVHGLDGAVNLDVLELSYNTITRIAGLESMKRLQRLSVDHNQLISTKGLREVYTLLHLDCSHNHLISVEGLDNCALLSTLDLRGNNLMEPPSLNNQVLLRELRLDNNSIFSLQGLTASWLPLMWLLSAAQNSITQLPSMSDHVSLANLDLRYNCLSELRDMCKSLEGCPALREIQLTGNPLQVESAWRSTLQKVLPGLRAVDGQQSGDSSPLPPAAHGGRLPSGSFRAFCRAQLQQTLALQQQHRRELSGASSPLDAVNVSCRHFTEALQLAEDQRYAHEYGDTDVSDRTKPEQTLDATKLTDRPEIESPGNTGPLLVPLLGPTENDGRGRTFEEKSATWRPLDETMAAGPEMRLPVSSAASGSCSSQTPCNPRMTPISNPQKLDLKNTAAVVIQQHCRKHRHKCGNIISPPTAEKGGGRKGDGGKVASGPSHVQGSVLGPDHAATIIQAPLEKDWPWLFSEDSPPRSPSVSDQLLSPEAPLEKDWPWLFSEDSPPRSPSVSDQLLSPEHPGLLPEPSQYTFLTPVAGRPMQVWVPGEQVESVGHRVSPESTNRPKSRLSTSVSSNLFQRSEKIREEWGFSDNSTALLLLKRAQKMKPKEPLDSSARLTLFRKHANRPNPSEARTRPAADDGHRFKVGEAERDLQWAGNAEQMRLKEERTSQWVQTQTPPAYRQWESERFLPEIDPGVLSRGKVQLVSCLGYREHPDHANASRANSGAVSQPRKEHSNPPRNSQGHARKEVPSPQRVTSSPSKKERISFRDNPVQWSDGWGAGKKRNK